MKNQVFQKMPLTQMWVKVQGLALANPLKE